jgi:hypothetical protein
MTRIGRYQIEPHNLLAMLPRGETISPRSKFSRPNCVDQYQCATVAPLSCRSGNMAVHTLATPDQQPFFEIAYPSSGNHGCNNFTSGARTPRRPEACRITLISPHGLVGRGEYREHGATAGRAGKCEIHRTADTLQARETT